MASAAEPAPIAIGLMLCDQIIIDKDTNKPCLIGVFTGLAVHDFEEPQRFSVFLCLTNGRGQVELELTGVRLDNGESIFRQTYETSFPSPLSVVNVSIRIRSIQFPAAGWYDFVVRAKGELIAQKKIRVYVA